MVSYSHTTHIAPRSAAARSTHQGFNSANGLSAMLLAAMVSALLVVADQLIDSWADGHLLAAWIALWVIGFAAIAIFAGSARMLAVTAVHALDAWTQKISKHRADKRLWLIAQSDPRVLADLNAAMTRNES